MVWIIPGATTNTYAARESGTYTVSVKAPGYAKSSASVYVDGVYCENAIQIYNAAGLYAVRNNLAANYELMANIDISSYTNWSPIGNSTLTPFTGQFCGNRHEISGLSITGGGTTPQSGGLFGYLGNGAVVREVGVSVQNMSGYSASGGIAGTTQGNVKITNVYTTGTMNNSYAISSLSTYGGGIVGVNNGTLRIETSYSTMNVTISHTIAIDSVAGGILGYNGLGGKVTIINSYSTGEVYAQSAWTTRAGGILGNNADVLSSATVQNCYAVGNITAQSTSLVSVLNAEAVGIGDGTIVTSAALSPSVLSKGTILSIVIAYRVGSTGNNFALSSMKVNGTILNLIPTSASDGTSKTQTELSTRSTYESAWSSGLGWKFGDNVDSPWKWSDTLKRPILYWQ